MKTITGLLLMLGFIGGCSPSPSQRLDLSGTRWSVTSIAGKTVATGTPVAVAFDSTFGYTITGPCQVITGDTWIDTDGDGFGFREPVRRASPQCETASGDAAAMDALLAVGSWRVVDDNHITLVGPSTVELLRSSA